VKNAVAVMLIIFALTLSLNAQSSQCLIVRSAEGHRFRNAMIAGVLTGGIGLVAGAAFSGAKYEYADSYNLAPTKPKYSGGELGKLQSAGVHVIVVNKKTASGEMESARNSCKSSTGPATPAIQVVQAPAVVPVSAAPVAQAIEAPISVSAPVTAKTSLCLESTIQADGKETCTKYAQQ